MIIDPSLSLNDGAILPLKRKNSFIYQMIRSMFKKEDWSLDTPYKKLPSTAKEFIFFGSESTYRFVFRSIR